MIKITKNNWRPFIELTALNIHGNDDDGVFYFDVTKRPLIIQQKDNTLLDFGDSGAVFVKESAKDIIKAVDKLIAAEAEARQEEARRNMEETLARVAATEQTMKGE